MSSNMYRVGDYVYFEISSNAPLQIRRIEELNKTPSGNVEAKVMCFYRRRDISPVLLRIADQHQGTEQVGKNGETIVAREEDNSGSADNDTPQASSSGSQESSGAETSTTTDQQSQQKVSTAEKIDESGETGTSEAVPSGSLDSDSKPEPQDESGGAETENAEQEPMDGVVEAEGGGEKGSSLNYMTLFLAKLVDM